MLISVCVVCVTFRSTIVQTSKRFLRKHLSLSLCCPVVWFAAIAGHSRRQRRVGKICLLSQNKLYKTKLKNCEPREKGNMAAAAASAVPTSLFTLHVPQCFTLTNSVFTNRQIGLHFCVYNIVFIKSFSNGLSNECN